MPFVISCIIPLIIFSLYFYVGILKSFFSYGKRTLVLRSMLFTFVMSSCCVIGDFFPLMSSSVCKTLKFQHLVGFGVGLYLVDRKI